MAEQEQQPEISKHSTEDVLIELDPVALEIRTVFPERPLSLDSLRREIQDLRLLIEDQSAVSADQNEQKAEQDARIARSLEQKSHANFRARLPGMIYSLLILYSAFIFLMLLCEGFRPMGFHLEKEVLQGFINTLAMGIVGMAVTMITLLFNKN